MLRIEVAIERDVMTIRMEGRFVAQFAEDARALLGRSEIPFGLVVDLSEVSFVDSTGEDVLVWLRRIGATFVAQSAYSLDVCKRLRLPVAAEPACIRSTAPWDSRNSSAGFPHRNPQSLRSTTAKDHRLSRSRLR